MRWSNSAVVLSVFASPAAALACFLFSAGIGLVNSLYWKPKAMRAVLPAGWPKSSDLGERLRNGLMAFACIITRLQITAATDGVINPPGSKNTLVRESFLAPQFAGIPSRERGRVMVSAR